MTSNAVRTPLYLSLCLLPLAVAGHNIGTGIVALILFWQIYQRRAQLPLAEMKREFGVPLAISCAFIAMLVSASILNPTNPDHASWSLIFGHSIWALLPVFVCLAQPRFEEQDWRRVATCLALVTAFMGSVAIAQTVWGFKVQGAHFVIGSTRAQGFYSHPLTFAYVGILLFPLGCASVAREPKSWVAWAQFLGASAVIYASQSRTAQAVCAVAALFNLFYFAKGRVRTGLIVVGGIAVLMAALIDNPMRTRFIDTVKGGYDRQSSAYADDRLAFWDANWEMVKERPIIGHGDHLDTAYRAPYYAKIGLPNFTRMYEAHNMYLQTVVNAGVIGLIILLAWLAWYLRRTYQLGQVGFGGIVALETFVAIMLAAMTQNAFQDSEVRYGMTLLCTAIWLAGPVRRLAVRSSDD